MPDFLYRTEDISLDELPDLFVETRQDRKVIDSLKSRTPTVLIGSRGVGKSFLLRIAQKELKKDFLQTRVFPVYLSFIRGSLLDSSERQRFSAWMLAKICSAIIRALKQEGLLLSNSSSVAVLSGGAKDLGSPQLTPIETVAEEFENSWKQNSPQVNTNAVPKVDDLKEALEDIGEELRIKRFVLLIDEAAHIFAPEQQRQFFTLFRDLRSSFLTCNAAVYPGVTSYGDSFQPHHDADMVNIDRDITSSEYVANMKEIVEKQSDSTTIKALAQNGQNFAVLAYASSGNPRILLKTVALASKVNSTEVNAVFREFYKNEIWAEHSKLSEKYRGHRKLIDWGRNFVEETVLPDLKIKNETKIEADKKTSAYFWIHRDAPTVVREAMKILAYTGIVRELDSSIKASRSEIGSRYMVNLGCLFALESVPASTAFAIATSLTLKRMTEFGQNFTAFQKLEYEKPLELDKDVPQALEDRLKKDIAVLDLTPWQKRKLREVNINSIGEALKADKAQLTSAYYVGERRASKAQNAALSAVLEYLSG